MKFVAPLDMHRRLGRRFPIYSAICPCVFSQNTGKRIWMSIGHQFGCVEGKSPQIGVPKKHFSHELALAVVLEIFLISNLQVDHQKLILLLQDKPLVFSENSYFLL